MEDIDIDGGTLTAEQGRIELGNARDGQVSLDAGFVLSYQEYKTLVIFAYYNRR
ncbi:hypothetical protein H6F98_31875 [Microcoleus sp. FACHB-SPT15]|uniref:hypothetical protein n=1 Tax=Microcoleus sp. FACHB-SPT15 TaxID=2692830 RepID=UPI0017824AD8|nr:hypothetical protein [Microcoleus sp. FACHB-SPT15]MBD1810015.1 hypothetical protein [Microcoleus sp. FACHB-SPT15]